MSWKWSLLALAIAHAWAADDVALIPAGALWRWIPGRAPASSPGDAWRALDFDDRSWAASPSGFAFDHGECTILSGIKDFNSLYLRHEFRVEEPEAIRWLTLRVDYAGGFVAYLNGTEVVRRGLPGLASEPVPYNTPGEAVSTSAPEEIDLSAFACRLCAGTNVLAIQWHNAVPLGYGLNFVPELRGNFTRGPFVQNTAADRQQIVWKTLLPSDTIVEYGLTPALGERVEDPTLTTNHVATVAGLAAGTLHYYRVASTAGGRTGRSPVSTFRTFRRSGSLSFSVMADVGSGNVYQHSMARVIETTEPDLVLVSGDLVYPSYSNALADARFFSVYEPQMRSCPYFVVAGNHDYQYGVPAQFFDAFAMPTNSVSIEDHLAAGTDLEAYYSFDHGDAHFVGLFVPLMDSRTSLIADSAQCRWLEADLAATTAPWKFLFLHHHLESSKVHRNDDYNYNGIADRVELCDLLLPIARRYGVQMIFSGHDHGYERFNPVEGVHLVVSAVAGGTVYPLLELDPACAQFFLAQNCVNIRVEGDTLELRALGLDGNVFDTMFLQRAPPTHQPFTAAWNSPVVERALPDDDDANVTGQSFDFAGPPLPTAPGDFSNLGRVYVNHDHNFLYVGFEQVMLHPDNTLFLFLDSPGLAGVTTMAGLGNGAIDPAGEGADGLDFLENLSFTNFSPGLACILGDEYGDRQARSFLRTNATPTWLWPPRPVAWPLLALDIGQGVFYLDAGFTDVPGARFQQYNRSPQTSPVPGEQNANFIEVAIPLAALNVRPGDRLRLGAVVGGGAFSIHADAQTRFLDRSFLGVCLQGAGQDRVVLEGVSVDLGPDLDPDDDGLLTHDELARGTDPANPDTDGDGLTDGWEMRFALDPKNAEGIDGGAGDPDSDGFTNAQEQAAETDPRSALSVLRLQVVLGGDGVLRFVWPARLGALYSIESTTSIETPFGPLAGSGLPVRADLTEMAFETDLPGPSGPAVRFYRLVLEAP